MLESEYKYIKTVQFYDTDLMGVVHHSNYLRYFEEARVDWLRAMGLEDTHYPKSDRLLAVMSSQVVHDSPCRFGDRLEISLQVRAQRLKIEFQYVIYNAASGARVARGSTTHVLVDKELKPRRPDRRFLEVLEKQKWTETLL